MSVAVIVRPASIITMDQAKSHLRVEHGDDDADIERLIFAAQAHIDGPSGDLGRAIGLQTLELTLDGCELWPGAHIDLPYPPYVELVSISYLDPLGAQQSLATEAVAVINHGGLARLYPLFGSCWPLVLRRPGAVRVRYRAGYETPELDAVPIQQAMLLMIGHWYRNREAESEVSFSHLPLGVDALLGPYRVWRF
ncbi:head-tail connector protein [Xanthobacter sp. DSM 24535]|uniref:head-tail connector protein n=1 Tax=Roseixanthobacter psychrophilus TaxID=3119917 RepID=UPI003727859B